MKSKKNCLLIFLLLLGIRGLADEIDISQLKTDVLTNKVRVLEVIYLPYATESIMNISPESLINDPDATISKVRCKNEIRTSLVEALNKTKVNPSNEEADLRWGMIFYDKDKNQIHSIYIDKRYLNVKTNKGYIDGKTVQVNDALIDWLELHFKPKKHRILFLF